MNLRLLCIALLIAGGVIGCSSIPRTLPHPTVALLFLEKGGNAYPRGAEAYVILRAIDGEPTANQTVPEGAVLRPGWRQVVLSAKRDAGTRIGGLIMGEMGSTVGRAIDELGSTQFDRHLGFRAEAGHDYLARLQPGPYGFEYTIKDVTRNQVVADSRQFQPGPRW